MSTGLRPAPDSKTYSDLGFCRSPNGIRTRVATLRGWCPRPLDDGALQAGHHSGRSGEPVRSKRRAKQHRRCETAPVPFNDVVQSEAELRTLFRPPGQPALRKQIDHIDDHCQSFLAHTPFVIIATTDPDGRCDASPKGGPPGFVRVLDDHRVAIPDLSGN